MSTRLEHKTALATGATSNIGRAIATAFRGEGRTSSSADAAPARREALSRAAWT